MRGLPPLPTHLFPAYVFCFPFFCDPAHGPAFAASPSSNRSVLLLGEPALSSAHRTFSSTTSWCRESASPAATWTKTPWGWKVSFTHEGRTPLTRSGGNVAIPGGGPS